MANKNPDNMHWKAKLEDTESLPAETVGNKQAAWKKLNRRLHEKPRRKRAAAYWAAAACVLIFLCVPFLFSHKYENAITKNNVYKDEAVKPGLKEIHPLKKEITINIPAARIEQKEKTKTKVKNTDDFIADTAKDLPAINNLIAGDVIVSSPPAIDSAVPIIVASAGSKKKLRVIHINELTDPVQESPELARTADQHIFRLRLANEERYGTNIRSTFLDSGILKTIHF